MKEYIEREAAVTVCSNQYKECLRKSDWCGETAAWNICYGIKSIPAADVVERKRGSWVGEADGYADGELVYDVWYCSECNHCIDDGTDDPDLLPNFCPNCGADMRRADHENL